MERIERPESIIQRVGIAKAPVPKEAGAKRVLYGVWDSTKKVVESQSPEAWKNRIITIIDRQIIPRLPPEKQQWVDDHWEGIQEAATYAGVGITTAEIVGAVAITKYGFEKASNALLNHGIEAHLKKYPETSKPLPVTWATDPRSMTAVEYALRPSLKDPNPEFTKWMIDVVSEYRDKYGDNPTDVNRFATTMRNLAIGAGDMSSQGSKREWVKVLDKALDKHPWKARSGLKKIFTKAYIDVLRSEGAIGIENGHIIRDAIAQRAYDQWANVQFPGLEDLLYRGQPYPDMNQSTAVGAALSLTHNARDFESIKPPSFQQILEGYQAQPVDPVLLYEMAQDPKWKGWVESLPAYEQVKEIEHKLFQAEQDGARIIDEIARETIAREDKMSGLRQRLRVRKAQIAARKTPSRVAEAIAAVEHNPAVRAVRNQRELEELERRAAERLVSRNRMGGNGSPRIRESPRQVARRLDVAEARSQLHQRVRASDAQTPEERQEKRVIRAVTDAMHAALDAPMEQYRDMLQRAAHIDPNLAMENPRLVAAIADQVATLGTNETTAARELATLLVTIGNHREDGAYQGLLEQLQNAQTAHDTHQALVSASHLLERAYNNQSGVNKSRPFGTLTDTKFTTLAGLWTQRLGFVGLDLLARTRNR